MARGADNQPKHSSKTDGCKIVLWEQAKHRTASRNNGFSGGEAGPHWQSHHIICLMAMAKREVPDAQKQLLEDCLYITDWNINEAPNMIGLPTRAWYRKAYSAGNFYPLNLPSHNNDHNITGGYANEVYEYVRDNIYSKINPEEKDHTINAETLKSALEEASEYFEGVLLDRGERNGGTKSSFESRFEDNTDKSARRAAHSASSWSAAMDPNQVKPNQWYFPFSMSLNPKPRSPGQSESDLTWLFSSDFWK